MKACLRAVVRWAADWRNGAVIIGTVLVAYLGVFVVTGIQDRQRAIDTAITATASEREARVAAIHRIDQLLRQIGALQGDAQANGARIARLTQEVVVLEQQIRQLGGEPVVTVGDGTTRPATSSPSPSRTAPPSPTPRPTPSHTHPPSPSPSPTPVCRLLPLLCP